MDILARLTGRNKQMGEADMSWYELGASDARLGMMCIPEMYVTAPADKLQYCLGYNSVKPGTLTATYFIQQQPVAEMAVMA